MRTAITIAAIAAGAGALSGCVGAVAVGAGATVASAASQERGISGTARDTAIRARIYDLWFDRDLKLFADINMQVLNGRVLLTGFVDDEALRVDAVRLAWKADGVREVINEIRVGGKGGLANYAKDSWIITELKGRLLFDKEVRSVNYSVEAVGGVVYLIGIARSPAERDRVINHARNLAYVKRVVSYVRIKGADRASPS